MITLAPVRPALRQTVAAIGATLVTALCGCESGSSGGDSSSVSASSENFSGRYTNGGGPIPAQNSGARVTRLDLSQSGSTLNATDNNGKSYSGNIGEGSSDGSFPFNLEGQTSDGQPVVVSGTLRRSGSEGIMSGTWYEPSLQSPVNAKATLGAPAPAAGETPAPTAGETPPSTPPPTAGSGADYVNAPASFNVATCDFRDDGDVGNWPITTVMRSVSVSGGKITMVYDDVNWKASGDPAVNGNCWFVLERGGWEAKTFDFLRPNQEVKDVNEAVHIFGIKRGEKVGVFVSTLARDSRRNGDERSQIYWITWP